MSAFQIWLAVLIGWLHRQERDVIAYLMEENTMLWKLKEMEYVEKIADKISNISVSGNGVLIEQLKQIFVPQK